MEKNLLVEWRSAEGDAGRLPALVDELVRLNVELLVAISSDAEDAAKQASRTIPIVTFGTTFPIERGLIKSFARPGGNITGTVWFVDPEVTFSKQYQIFKDAVPGASRVYALYYGADPALRFWDRALERRLAKAMGLTVQDFPLHRPEAVKPTLERIASSRPDVLSVSGNVQASLGAFPEIAAFALQHKLVSYSESERYPRFGGLLSYGPNFLGLREFMVSYVDRILRGAKAADLPVQQTTKWDLVLNAKTAQAIGFRPPPAFMLQVTRQIE
jgi:putative ABC transport system substrate-binding protein